MEALMEATSQRLLDFMNSQVRLKKLSSLMYLAMTLSNE